MDRCVQDHDQNQAPDLPPLPELPDDPLDQNRVGDGSAEEGIPQPSTSNRKAVSASAPPAAFAGTL
jgi:hypothetical protein